MTNKPSLVDFRALGPAAFVLLLALGHSPAAAQQTSSEDRTRQLWNTAFRAKRPAEPTSASASTSTATAAQKSTEALPLQPDEEDPGDSLVGITVWRLRPSLPEDDKDMRISALDGRGDLTPERIEAETPLREGEKVRVSIEAARSGYLYVIDREQYADGTFGTPYLIFPHPPHARRQQRGGGRTAD